MSDRHRFRNLLYEVTSGEMEDDQLVELGEYVQAELRKRELDREENEAAEARKKLGIFLELKHDYTFTFFRVTGRTARPKHGFEPLLCRFPGQRHTHMVEPDTAEGITFPLRRKSIQLLCGGGSFDLSLFTPEYRTGNASCSRCVGTGKIAVAVSRPKESE